MLVGVGVNSVPGHDVNLTDRTTPLARRMSVERTAERILGLGEGTLSAAQDDGRTDT